MPRRFELEELVRLPSFYFPALSRERDRIAYFGDRTGRIELYVLDARPGAAPRLVAEGAAPRSPRTACSWLPGGQSLVMARDRDGDEQHGLYRVDVDTGAVTPLTDARAQHYPGRASPDGGELLVMSNRDGQLNVYVLELASRRLRRLTDFPSPAWAADWSPDGEWVYLTANAEPDLRNEDVYRVRRDGSGLERIYSSGVGTRDAAVMVSPDGRWLAIASDASGFVQPLLLDLRSGAVRAVGDGSGDESPVDFAPDGSRLLTLLSRDARTLAVEVDLATGARRVLPAPAGVVFGARYLHDGRILLHHTAPRFRPRLLVLDPASGQVDVLVDAEYGRLSPDDFVDARYVHFTSDDGLRVPGILYKPPVPPGGRLPAIVLVHGGPTAQDLLQFNPYVQLLANRGFAVLQVNYRGSTGYGRAYMEMNLGDIGGGDARDVAAGARFLASDPDVDPDRILCAGGSYGGYMTYRQLTRFPELWAGGVAWVGITDWELLYRESMEHFKYYLRLLFGGSPDEVPERYREASPIHEAHRLRAPLLMVHGVNDPRCPVIQARAFRERLLALGRVEGRDFLYHELGDQGHGSLDVEDRLVTFRLLEAFVVRFA